MFKDNAKNWLYLLGVLIMIGILALITREIMFPLFYNREAPPILDFLADKSPDFYIDLEKEYSVIIKTNLGDAQFVLYDNSAPQNVNNFLYLTASDFYDDTSFFRLNPGLILQGGDRNTLNDDPKDDGFGNPDYIISDEINFDSLGLSDAKISELENLGYTNSSELVSQKLRKYSLVMANSGPNTNGSQFFIVLAESNDPRLDQMQGRFTVIGQLTNGQELFDRISNIRVDNPTLNSPRPLEEIIINDVEVLVNGERVNSENLPQ